MNSLNTLLRRLIVPVFMFLFSNFNTAQTKPVTLTFDLGTNGGWYPHHSLSNAPIPGTFEAILIELSKHLEVKFEGLRFPPKRTESNMNNGLIDLDFICLEWFHDKQNDDSKFVVSDPLFFVTEYLVTLQQNAPLFPNSTAAYDQPIGTIAGYFYHDDSQFDRVDFLNEAQLLIGLERGRFKAAILEYETAKYWANQTSVKIAFAAIHSQGKIRIRLQKKHQPLLASINRAIAQIKRDGTLRKILDERGINSELVELDLSL